MKIAGHMYIFLSFYDFHCTTKVLQTYFNPHVLVALGSELRGPVIKFPLNPTVETSAFWKLWG